MGGRTGFIWGAGAVAIAAIAWVAWMVTGPFGLIAQIVAAAVTAIAFWFPLRWFAHAGHGHGVNVPSGHCPRCGAQHSIKLAMSYCLACGHVIED